MIGPKGVEVNIGIFYRDMTRIEYRHIRGVNLRQSLFNRFMSIGQILVSTSGMDTELIISDINRPVYFTEIIKNRLKGLS
ncbi:MAG: PH domain-containing protein [Gammaproteobacteria bacterium]|nr:PH domain-containing protein [Gammaproteobacteria bacterium]